MNNSQMTGQTVAHVAALSQLELSEEENGKFQKAFLETLEVVDQLQAIDTSNINPTHQVTGLENVWREDKVLPERMFTQEQALANAKQQHNGFFVVPRLIDQDA